METTIARISIMLVPALLAVTLHEVAHGFVADRCGDPTARLLGRLTLNPLRHLDPIGTLVLLVFGFGWAKPVPVNFNNLRHPRRDMIWVALSGPLTNFSLAALSALLLHALALGADWLPNGHSLTGAVLKPAALMVGFSLYVNVILGLFNLIPLPPLDGGRVMAGILPPRQSEYFARIEPFGFFLIIALIFFTDVYSVILHPLIQNIVTLLAGEQQYLVRQAIQFLIGR